MRIIVVDDDEISLEILQNIVESEGFEVTAASNGEDALRLLRETGARLIISDWEMPGMNGLALCQQIRRESWPGYVYIILLTAHDQADDVIRGLSAGADDFVSKPFEPTELNLRIHAGVRILSMETRDIAIFSMAKLAESRDPEMGLHLERMRDYSRILAQALTGQGRFPEQLNAEYVHMLFLTSPLHDIGKVSIPDSILLKPGRLSHEEFEIMKTHSTAGAETLGAAALQYPGVTYLQMAHRIAKSHHERFDGKGYPAGLRGEEIPLCARIVALADVYDALTSTRVYKEAFEHTVARNIILEEEGRQFDPAIVDAFRTSEAAFQATRAEYTDEALASEYSSACSV